MDINPLKSTLSHSDGFNELNCTQLIQKFEYVTEKDDFDDGLTKHDNLAGEFSKHANERLYNGIKYIAGNCNPNQTWGNICNGANYLANKISGKENNPLILNQNCVSCAKAAERNLAQIEKKQINTFYVAENYDRGYIPNDSDCNPANYISCSPNDHPGKSFSSTILDYSEPNTRYLLNVTVKGYSGHAMNLVRNNVGNFVIDAQMNVIYNLNSEKDADAFNKKFGQNSQGYYNAVMQKTGTWSDIELTKGYQIIDSEPEENMDDEFEILETDQKDDSTVPEQNGGYFAPLNVIKQFYS